MNRQQLTTSWSAVVALVDLAIQDPDGLVAAVAVAVLFPLLDIPHQ
jgi:hypothetical protein